MIVLERYANRLGPEYNGGINIGKAVEKKFVLLTLSTPARSKMSNHGRYHSPHQFDRV